MNRFHQASRICTTNSTRDMEIPDRRTTNVAERGSSASIRRIDVAIDGVTIAIEGAHERSDDGTY